MIRPQHLWHTLKVLALIAAIWQLLGPVGREATADTPEARAGAGALVGTLEGPTVITDPAQFPKSFNASPALAELVKAGKLPPVRKTASVKIPSSSSRSMRSVATAGPGAAASPARPIRPPDNV